MSYEPDRSKSRIIWVDIARAVAMVLVFTGHLGASWFPQLEPLLTAIYTFHMPLFFLLSGLFFKPTVNLLNLIIKRAKTLLIPYYLFSVFALVSPIVKLLRPSLYESAGKSADSNPLSAIIAIVFAQGNAGLWFLWSLFVAIPCLWLTVRVVRSNKLVLAAVLLVYLIIDFFLKGTSVVAMLPFQLGKIFEATAYVGFGYLIAQACDIRKWDRLNFSHKLGAFLVFTVAFLILEHFFASQSVATGAMLATLALFTTFFGMAMAIAFSLLLPEARCFATIGRDSLVFYALNDLALKMVKFVLFSAVGIPVASLPLGGQLLVGFLTIIVAIAVCYVLDIFIQHHMRWAIGDFGSVRHS